RLDDDEPPVIRRELGLDGRQQLGADPLALPRGIDDDPVEVVGPGRPGRGAPAGIAHELIAGERAEKVILLVAVEGVVEQLHRDGDLVRPEQAGGRGELLKSCALGAADGTERAAHAPPWPPARRATPPRRCAVPARRSPTRRPEPWATGRRHRSGRGWGSRRGSRRGPGRRAVGPRDCTPSPAFPATRPPRPGPTGRRASGGCSPGRRARSPDRRATRRPTSPRR